MLGNGVNADMGLAQSLFYGARAIKTVGRGNYSAQQLLADGCDSYKEDGRDCYMLPNNDDAQISMDTICIEPR